MNIHALNRPRPTEARDVLTVDMIRRAADAIARNGARIEHDYYTDVLRYYRQNPVAYRQAVEGDFRPAFQTVEFRARGTRDENMFAARILRELDWQYMRWQQLGVRPADMRRAAFVLSFIEWDTLRRALPWHELEAQFGRQAEGAAVTYRGYPVAIR